MHRLLQFRQCQRVFAAGKWAFLERLQPVDNDGEQRLVSDAVGSDFWNRSILEQDSRMDGSLTMRRCPRIGLVCRAAEPGDLVEVVRSTATGFVLSLDSQGVVTAIDLMSRDLSQNCCSLNCQGHRTRSYGPVRNRAVAYDDVASIRRAFLVRIPVADAELPGVLD